MQVAQMTFYCIGQMQSKSNKVSPDVKARVDGVPQDLEEGGIALNEVHAFEHLDDQYYTFEHLDDHYYTFEHLDDHIMLLNTLMTIIILFNTTIIITTIIPHQLSIAIYTFWNFLVRFLTISFCFCLFVGFRNTSNFGSSMKRFRRDLIINIQHKMNYVFDHGILQ